MDFFFGWADSPTAGSEQESEVRPDQNNQTSELLITINKKEFKLQVQVPLLFSGYGLKEWRAKEKNVTDWDIRTKLINQVLSWQAERMSYSQNCYASKK